MKILLISELPILLKIITNYLMTEMGLRNCQHAGSAKEGIKLLNTNKYDAVLCSREMQHMDGFAVHDQMLSTQINRNTAFIMMTSNVSNNDLYILVDQGIKHYLPIPCEPLELRKIIDEAVNARQYRKFPRYAIHHTTALLIFNKSQFDAEIINISKNGVLCTLPSSTSMDNVDLNCRMTIFFPEEHNRAICKDIAASLVRLNISTIDDTNSKSKKSYQCVWKFDSIPVEAEKTLQRVIDSAYKCIVAEEEEINAI